MSPQERRGNVHPGRIRTWTLHNKSQLWGNASNLSSQMLLNLFMDIEESCSRTEYIQLRQYSLGVLSCYDLQRYKRTLVGPRFGQLSPTIINHQPNKMHASAIILGLIGLASAQTLKIPTRVGNIVSLPSPSVIKGNVDLGNREYDRGRPCNSDDDTGMST